jgi:hypothetical protein
MYIFEKAKCKTLIDKQLIWYILAFCMLLGWRLYGESNAFICMGCFLGILILILFPWNINGSFLIFLAIGMSYFGLPSPGINLALVRYLSLAILLILLLSHLYKVHWKLICRLFLRIAVPLMIMFLQYFRGGEMADHLINGCMIGSAFIAIGYLAYNESELKEGLMPMALLGSMFTLVNAYLPGGKYGIHQYMRMIAIDDMDPNYYAACYILPFCAAIILAIKQHSIIKRIIAFINIVIILYGIMGTGSRGAFIATIGMSIYIALRLIKKSRIRTIIVGMVFVIMMGYVINEMLPKTPLGDRFNTELLHREFDHPVHEQRRLDIWQYYILELFPNNIMIGQGFRWPASNMATAFLAAHNSFIQIIVDHGVIGSTIIIMCLWPVFVLWKRIVWNHSDIIMPNDVQIYLMGSVIGILLINTFITGYTERIIYLTIGISLRAAYQYNKMCARRYKRCEFQRGRWRLLKLYRPAIDDAI